MNYALFRCCPTSIFLKQYETSTDAVLKKLEVAFVDIKTFNCCGYPLKNIDLKAYALSSARNLALAAKNEVGILTVCNCCFNTIKHVIHLLDQDGGLKAELNAVLSKEDLVYDRQVEVKHLFEVLYDDIGPDTIRKKRKHAFSGLKIAVQYGCHILRPADLMQFDDPISPSKFDQLVTATGAESVDWTSKLECCGSPMWGVDDDLSMDLTDKKLKDAGRAGANYLCSACVYCQLQFDRVQKMMLAKRNQNQPLPSILYTQLLGLSLGIDAVELGIEQNELDITGIKNFLT